MITAGTTSAPVTFEPYREYQAEKLVALMTGSTWPFQRTVSATPGQVRSWIAESMRPPEAQEAHWVVAPGGERVGLLHLEDLHRATATTDFRLRADRRGYGYGRATARFAADRVFSTYPNVARVEVVTRVGNLAMRSVLRASPGWVMEAYYRRSWPDPSGVWHDGVGYAILRGEWATGVVTPVDRRDE